MDMSRNLEAALAYAELGYRVFPCVPNGKVPACEHGCLDATDEDTGLKRGGHRTRCYNVAIATEGRLVLDIDPAGKKWLATVHTNDLMRGTMTSTPRGACISGSSRTAMLCGITGHWPHGVDTRGNGGYVLVPPSVVNGKPYQWVVPLETVQPAVPQWLIDRLAWPATTDP